MPLGAFRLNTLGKVLAEPFTPVSATGGTTTDVTVGGTDYRIHEFTSDGTFTVTAGGDVDILLVGGGGSG